MKSVSMTRASAIKNIFSTLFDIPFPSKVNLKIIRNTSAIESEEPNFLKAAQAVLTRYADKDEQGNVIIKDGQISCSSEVSALINQEIDSIYLSPIDLPCTFTMEEIELFPLTPRQFAMLEILIEQ